MGLLVERRSWLIALLSKEGGLSYNFVPKRGLLIVDYKNLLVLVILIVVHVQVEALVEVLVNNLYLFIRLRVVSYR